MRKFYFLFAIFGLISQTLTGQWTQNQSFTGGGIINDIISFQNKIYIAVADNGLFSSNDNGDSWSKVNLDHNWSIDRLEIHKDQLVAATSGYIFISNDGDSWNKYEKPGSFVRSIQSDGDVLYVAHSSGGIFKSEDDGQTWIDINNENTSIGVESFHKAGDILYAGKINDSGILYKSEDEGQNWVEISTGQSLGIKEIGSNSSGLYLNLTEKLLHSTDNGLTWSDITGGLSGQRIYFTIIQEEIIYVNTNRRVYNSLDNGGNWQGSDMFLDRYNSSSLYVDENNIFVGMWGGGVSRNTLEVDEAWSAKNYGLFLDNVHQIGFLNDTIYAGTEFSFVKTSADEGEIWLQETDEYSNKGDNARSMAIFNSQVYVGSGGSGISTKKASGNWEKISEALPGQIIDGLCANKNYIFAAVSDYGVYRSNDPESSWEKKDDGLSSGIRDLYAIKDYLFAGTWDGLFLSTDEGESWVDITGDIPDRSINSMVLIDSTIIAATQNGGAFRSKDFGVNWEKISGENIRYLTSKNRTIFKCSAPGSIAASYDIGDTWENINDNITQDAYITALGFSNDYMFAGFGRPGQGIWQRVNHEIIPPSIADAEDKDDSVIRENESITITSDQQLMDEEGKPLDSDVLNVYVKVLDSDMQEVAFTGSINSSSTVIEIDIIDPTDGETYVVQIDSLSNESNLKTGIFTSQAYTFTANKLPILSPIAKNGIENIEIVVPKSEILSSYVDEDEDPMENIYIIAKPKNGILSMEGTNLDDDTNIDINDLKDLLYTPNTDFVGNDTVSWSAFDGFDYAESSLMVFTMDAITGMEDETNLPIVIYPNPSNGTVTSSIRDSEIGAINFKLMGVNGKIFSESVFDKNSEVFQHSFTMDGLASGIYIVQYSGKYLNQTNLVIKR